MTLSVTHTFVSPVVDDGDADEVGPSEWNDGHVLSGGVTGTFLGAITGLTPAFRAIVGADLPNPSATTLGGVFSLAVTSNSVLSGIGVDGVPTRATTTGTGAVVRTDAPNFTGVVTVESNNFLSSPPGTPNVFYSKTGLGLKVVNGAGSANLWALSDTGVATYHGTTSGTHTIAAAAVAGSGASIWPTTSGTVHNTGLGHPLVAFGAAVDFNAVGDYPITLTFPPGVTRYRIQGIITINTGTTASLTTAQYGVFTSAAGAGVAIVASGSALSSITSNAAETSTSMLIAGPAVTAYFTDTSIFYRVTQAQGAAASGFAYLQVQPLP